ncbi:uncharacterized protein NECHADRAFT_101759 [Fusarium vanettenii 77-13-4]|uniref:Uncharacterized protein n=1 Tax=Fusarium vanettenii (strain ATCC MYA-4622 / CBS 123669 / FGSC 9596 / NRRL 45880 / 77-13-4) TaxID=660122 RepID=C7ZJ45_FUSV7|nr:uncharacterized protein NECHADRAFT_101759 [Fusarium vanettenii 77-13-4]EEU36012.1 predicted protein [Fusarium vanettenii 77-13-4]
MSGQPPPLYEEVIAEDRAAQEPPSALTVHLQVWHYRAEGRSPLNNDGLASLFRAHNLQAWEVIPFEADGVTGLSAHDQYVPVEVRFRHRVWAYNDPGENPMADVRELFFKTAPQFIYQFFVRINSTPHNLNIFPVNVPENFSSRYTHAFHLNQLSIRVNTFIVPSPAVTNEAQSWLQDAVRTTEDVLEILAAIVSLYLMHRNAQDQANGNNRAGTQQGARGVDVLDVHVPERLGQLRALFQRFREGIGHHAGQPPRDVADLQVAWNTAAGPFAEYMRLANRVESRLTKLENNLTLSNQDLYELVQDAHHGALLFSALKQAAQPLVRELEADYSPVINQYNTNRNISGIATAVIAVGAVFLFWNPAGWVALGAYGGGFVAGGATGVGVHSFMDAERGKAFIKKSGVREFGLAINEINRCANEAREAIAMVFCAQVMQKRLDETLPEHKKKDILATLGVHTDALPDAVYSQELIRDRLKRFREGNRNLRNMMTRVMKDANLEFGTTEQAM